MLEFSISLKNSAIEFSPSRSAPDLALLLPPTARISEKNEKHPKQIPDNVHLDPIPIHCFFNAITLGRRLAGKNGLSVADGVSVYVLHDILKSFLRFGINLKGERQWEHLQGLKPLQHVFKNCGIFDGFDRSFQTILFHHDPKARQQNSLRWGEITWHEQDLAEGKTFFPANTIGFTTRLHPALSNLFAIEHIKNLFIAAYVDAVRAEYAAFFDKVDEVTYRYEFVDPAKLSGDTAKDLANLARASNIAFKAKHLIIETPIGAVRPAEIAPDEATSIRVPFWLLLTIYADPTGIIFPIPSLPDDSPNTAFVERVKSTFYRGVEKLLDKVPSTRRNWKAKKAEIVEHLHETLAIVDGKYEDVRAKLVAGATTDAVCNLCGSNVSRHFLCSPITDLGASTGNFTDWHLGNIGSTCLLCAISNFKKVPPALQPAYKLVRQKKLVYLAVTMPNVSDYHARFDDATRKSILPFFDAPLKPKLVPHSLESLVTLNLIGALFLHDSIRESKVENKNTRELWLKPIAGSSPFAFFGEIGKRQSKREITALLKEMHHALNRAVTLLDPMLDVDIEVPFNTLTCIMGNTQGKHYELKFKPLQVSNKTGTLPIVCDGYHLLDAAGLDALEQLQTLVRTLRGKGVNDSMKISALASSPDDLIEVMTAIGGCNIETVLGQLKQLGNGENALVYLERMREYIHKYPLITELWR